MKNRPTVLSFIIAICLLASTFWQPAIAQDTPQISPFELSRYRAGGSVQAAQWNADATHILTTSRRSTVQVWEMNADAPDVVLFANGWVDGAVWNADESAILSWSNAPLTCHADCEFSVNLWEGVDESSTAPTLSFPHPATIHSAMWNEDESQILTTAADGRARLWSVEDQAIAAEFAHDVAVFGAIWNSDETQILSWSLDGTARLWDVESGEEMARFVHAGQVDGANWNADEDRVLTWGRDRNANIWDVDGQLDQELSHNDWVTSAQWSADGRQILTSSMDGTLRVWDARSGDEDQRIAIRGLVQGAAWNSDETEILAWTLTNDGHVVMIWDVDNERLIASLPHEEVVQGARWNTDDNRVLTWSDDGLVRVWVVPSGDDCVITSSITVRQRSIPSTEGEITGRLFEGDASVASGQAVGDDGFVWYQLIDESWVRSDVVEATGECETVPEIEP